MAEEAQEGTHQSGLNSPLGAYLARKVSKVPNSLWRRQNGCVTHRSTNSQLNIPLFVSEFSNFVQEHANLIRKGLAELVEILFTV